MSDRWQAPDLLRPITPEEPCGDSLENTQLLASFDAFRLFGQAKALDAPADKQGNWVENWIPKPRESPEWPQIRDAALAALARSKDLRLLAYLGTALLRTDGVAAFSETLTIASEWLETYWKQIYPRVDEDVIRRRSALNCFADPMAIVAELRKVPLVSSRQHGTFSLGDVDPPVEEDRVNAAFASMPLDELTQLHQSVVSAVASLKRIEAKTLEGGSSEAAPTFDPLTALLGRMSHALRGQLALRPGSVGAAAPGLADGAGDPASGAVSLSGSVKSRQDAVRALDAVADFFRRTEPSSPIPLFLERAKRLVSKDFLEVLADIAPEAVAQARAAGGLKPGE
jgi:type VI secretion system protein ImpA